MLRSSRPLPRLYPQRSFASRAPTCPNTIRRRACACAPHAQAGTSARSPTHPRALLGHRALLAHLSERRGAPRAIAHASLASPAPSQPLRTKRPARLSRMHQPCAHGGPRSAKEADLLTAIRVRSALIAPETMLPRSSARTERGTTTTNHRRHALLPRGALLDSAFCLLRRPRRTASARRA